MSKRVRVTKILMIEYKLTFINVNLQVRSHKECKAQFDQKLIMYPINETTEFCTIDDGEKDICIGDTGGPFYVTIRGYAFQV